MCIRDRYSTIKSVSYLDLLLPFTILLCMIVSILISVYVPSSRHTFDAENHASLVNVSIPLAIGMIVMMIPPICKVSWESIHKYLKEKYVWRQLLLSLILNWIFGPLLMTALAWLALFEHKEYREGIIMIGIARCIAMVLIWNQIAGGDNDLCVVLVVCNSVLQMVLYAPLQLLYCYVISNDHFQGCLLYTSLWNVDSVQKLRNSCRVRSLRGNVDGINMATTHFHNNTVGRFAKTRSGVFGSVDVSWSVCYCVTCDWYFSCKEQC